MGPSLIGMGQAVFRGGGRGPWAKMVLLTSDRNTLLWFLSPISRMKELNPQIPLTFPCVRTTFIALRPFIDFDGGRPTICFIGLDSFGVG